MASRQYLFISGIQGSIRLYQGFSLAEGSACEFWADWGLESYFPDSSSLQLTQGHPGRRHHRGWKLHPAGSCGVLEAEPA